MNRNLLETKPDLKEKKTGKTEQAFVCQQLARLMTYLGLPYDSVVHEIHDQNVPKDTLIAF